MKIHRLIAFIAAVVVTVSLTEVLSHERVGDPDTQPSMAAASAP